MHNSISKSKKMKCLTGVFDLVWYLKYSSVPYTYPISIRGSSLLLIDLLEEQAEGAIRPRKFDLVYNDKILKLFLTDTGASPTMTSSNFNLKKIVFCYFCNKQVVLVQSQALKN